MPAEIDSLLPLYENGHAGFISSQKTGRRLRSTVEREAGDRGTILPLQSRVSCDS